MMNHQDEDDFNLSDDTSIIDRLICERNEVRVRVNTMEIIKILPITNANLPNKLLSRFPIRYNSVVYTLSGSSCKIAGR